MTLSQNFLEMLQGPLYIEGYSNLYLHPEHRTYLAELSPEQRVEIVSDLAMWLLQFKYKRDNPIGQTYQGKTDHQMQSRVLAAVKQPMRHRLPWTAGSLGPVLEMSVAVGRPILGIPPQHVIKAIKVLADKDELSSDIRTNANALVAVWTRWIGHDAKGRGQIERLKALFGPDEKPLPISGREPWAKQLLDDIDALPAEQRPAFVHLLNHCKNSGPSKPSNAWLKRAIQYADGCERARVEQFLVTCFPLVDKAVARFGAVEVDVLKGLAWLSSQSSNADMARALGSLAYASYRRVPLFGTRSVRLGTAAVWALGQMGQQEAVAQLAMLKRRIKAANVHTSIDRALLVAAEQLGLPSSEVEEMAVPAYGLTQVGGVDVAFKEYLAKVRVRGNSAEIQWYKPDGSQQKSIPSFVKDTFPSDLKALKQQVKDINKLLPAQKERIETHYLKQTSWQFPIWRARYHDHPLVGTVVRRLIWRFASGEKVAAGLWDGTQFIDHSQTPIAWLDDNVTVSLWHPLDSSDDETIQAWRHVIDQLQVQQPFKQAHREIYRLTDAECDTVTYSNRYAAHLVRQYQFNALGKVRGWKSKTRLLNDGEYPPLIRLLPDWGLRAEFWVEGVGDRFNIDTNETGTFHYLATDQVRFYRLDAPKNSTPAQGGQYTMYLEPEQPPVEPIPLANIPALVLSEVMRDIDLFVGVASVGNDPTWEDGGPEGRYREYWYGVSFGELSISAETRKTVLEYIVPRLKIADRCHFEGRFLVVRGNIRSYKIHIGSSNILMQPSNQYLCILPKQTARTAKRVDDVYLPFEGDRTLAIILSKALMLAADNKITDPTIKRQIERSR